MVVAARTLKLVADGAETDVAVRLLLPEIDDGQWVCRYEIDWPDGSRQSFAAGIDAVQALLFAMQKIGVELYTSPHHASGRLTWMAADDGYGFPVPKTARDLLIGADKKFEG